MKRIVYLTAIVCMLIVLVPHITSAATYTTSATASPASVTRSTTTTISVAVKSASATKLLIDLEVYNASGQKVFQQAWDNQAFTAGQLRTFSIAWAVPASAATGAYSMKIGLFSPGWATLLNWNDNGGKVTVATGTTAPTATPKPSVPTATPKPSVPTATPKPGATATPKPAATATPKPAATATPKPAATATPQPSVPTATPVSGTGRYFSTLPPGSALPSDAECAAAVKSRPENKRMNATYNTTRGSQKLGTDIFSDARANSQIGPRVTGNFSGSTDEILQWTACKWGVDEDMVRAQAAVESWWQQTAKGDWTTDATRCAPGHGLGVDGTAGQCPESFGMLQDRYPYEKSAWPGIGNSTAFNLDTGYAIWRSCYEGYDGWLNDVEHGQTYAAGDAWGCVGRWYAGRWHTADAETYITKVKGYLSQRIWETAGFQEK